MNAQSKLPLSFSIALGVHLTCLCVGSAFLVKPPQFAVDQGVASMEVQLAEASQEPVKKIEEPAPQIHKEDILIPEPIPEPPAVVQHQAQESAPVLKGVQTQAKPDYLSNPAPVYPLESRRRGQEGIVLLSVNVDRNGNPLQINIKQSSGFFRLDQTAVKAVWRWKFSPARIGELPIDSMVEIPVRFSLKEHH